MKMTRFINCMRKLIVMRRKCVRRAGVQSKACGKFIVLVRTRKHAGKEFLPLFKIQARYKNNDTCHCVYKAKPVRKISLPEVEMVQQRLVCFEEGLYLCIGFGRGCMLVGSPSGVKK